MYKHHPVLYIHMKMFGMNRQYVSENFPIFFYQDDELHLYVEDITY